MRLQRETKFGTLTQPSWGRSDLGPQDPEAETSDDLEFFGDQPPAREPDEDLIGDMGFFGPNGEPL